MGAGHDGSLATVGFCGCAGCGAGDQAAAGGSLRQALTGSESSGDGTVDALLAGSS